VAKLLDLSVDERGQANLASKRPSELAELKSAWDAINAELPY
jgi:hypothetical protein